MTIQPDSVSKKNILTQVAALVAGYALTVQAQTCVAPTAAQFKKSTVVSGMSNPSHMAIVPDGRIFAIEQWSGKVHLYTPGSGRVVVGTVPTNRGRSVEDGMLGIAVDPNFAKNGWVYIFHTPATIGTNRLTRYTYANGAIANPKLMLEFQRRKTGKDNDQRHAGGGMSFNVQTGDLYISTGDDTYPFGDRSVYGPRDPDDPDVDALKTTANSNDLRGKVLRIKPLPFADSENPAPGVGMTYSIPAGNLFPIGQYPADKARPEIYTLGHRNPYRVKVDAQTGFAFVGEVGPDVDIDDAAKGVRGHDEINLIKSAGNYGWPFANADKPQRVRTYETAYLAAGYKAGDPFNLDKLQNLSKQNTGVTDLPPARNAILFWNFNGNQTGISQKLGGGNETAIMGPVYRFNPANTAAGRWPAFMHGKVVFADYSRGYMWYFKLDAANENVETLERLATSTGALIDLDMGPDGILYGLDYNGGSIVRYEYTGEPYAYTQCAEIKAGCLDRNYSNFDNTANLHDPSKCLTPLAAPRLRAPLAERRISLMGLKSGQHAFEAPAGTRLIEAFSVEGKRLFALRVEPSTSSRFVSLPQREAEAAASAGQGVAWLRFLGE